METVKLVYTDKHTEQVSKDEALEICQSEAREKLVDAVTDDLLLQTELRRLIDEVSIDDIDLDFDLESLDFDLLQ